MSLETGISLHIETDPPEEKKGFSFRRFILNPWIYGYIFGGAIYGAMAIFRSTSRSQSHGASIQSFPSSGNFSEADACLENHDAMQVYVVKPWIYGNVVSAIIYGAVATLYLAYVQLTRRLYPKFESINRQAVWLLGFATLIFIFCSLTLMSSFRKTVDLLNLPICSMSFAGLRSLIPGGAGTMGNITFMLTSWTGDALLIWRCLTIYHDLGLRKWLIVAFPIILQACSIALGTWFSLTLSSEKNDIYELMVYYESITLAQNTILTGLIISRLFVLRHRAQVALGSDFGYEYTSVAAMLTESQAMTLVSQSAMLALIIHVRDSGSTLVAYQVLSQVQALAPMLLLYRVIQGKTWSSDIFAQITKSCSFGGE